MSEASSETPPEAPTAAPNLPGRVLFGYGLAAAPVMYGYVLVLIMYLKFAVDDLGASPAVVGTIFLFAKLWDAVSDPMIGNLSDRTTHSSGRRRPWLLASAPLLAVFSVMAWAPPASLSGGALTAWIAVAVFGFYTAFTVFEVPHMSLGAEISLDTHQRNRIFGVRQIMRVLGMLTAGTLGTYWVGQGVGPAAAMAYGLAVLTVVLIASGVSLLPPERAEFRGRAAKNPFLAVRDVFRNRHARLLLFVIFIDAIGTGGIGVLIPFVIEYVVGMKDLVPQLLGLNMVATLIGIPLWIRLARRFEKRHLLQASMIGSGIGYGSVLMTGEGDWHVIAISSVIAGACSSCANTLGYTLKSEIIDYDEHETGDRKEGAYFSGWSFMSKLASGIMVGVVGYALSASEFIPNEPNQTDTVKNTMVLLMGGFPLACYFIGALAFSRFSLTEKDHVRIRAALDERVRSAQP